jgi:hypothetical protein
MAFVLKNDLSYEIARDAGSGADCRRPATQVGIAGVSTLLEYTPSGVRFGRELPHHLEELSRLAVEKSHRRQAFDHSRSDSSRVGRPNDRIIGVA